MPACVRRLFKFSDTNFIANLYRSNKVIWHSLQDFTFRSFITSSDPTSPKSKGDVGLCILLSITNIEEKSYCKGVGCGGHVAACVRHSFLPISTH